MIRIFYLVILAFFISPLPMTNGEPIQKLAPFSLGFDRALDQVNESPPSFSFDESGSNEKIKPSYEIFNSRPVLCKRITEGDNFRERLRKERNKLRKRLRKEGIQVNLEPTCRELCMMKIIPDANCK